MNAQISIKVKVAQNGIVMFEAMISSFTAKANCGVRGNVEELSILSYLCNSPELGIKP
jgi:hypothetical protein